MKKPSFVPNADHLETRVVMSGGVHFTSTGAAIMSARTLNHTYAQVEKAFSQFAHHGENFKLLEFNLAKAVSSIPWNRRDGLLDEVETEPASLQSDISLGVTRPVMTEMENTLQEVNSFVQEEVASDIIAIR